MEYDEWIDLHYPDKQSSINRCNAAVREMLFKFPELTIQVGKANGIFHCWAKDKDGNIVDPTYKQFDSNINYTLIAERFLRKDEIELSTGIVFLTTQEE